MADRMAKAGVRRFTGEALREVAFPLGGIGTGTVSLGGRGNLRDWEIFNRPGKEKDLPYTFFALWAKPEGGPSVARVLERTFMTPYPPQKMPTSAVSGLPRLKEATFSGGYPLAQIDFEDDALPVTVRLNAVNPFIPLNERDSGIPLATFTWTLHNPGPLPVEATVACSLMNACHYDGSARLGNRFHKLFGQNLNEFIEGKGLRGLRMSCGKYPVDHPQFGTMALTTTAEDVTVKTRWERAGWWDDAQEFWDDFAGDGLLTDKHHPDPSPEGQTDVGSLGIRLRLEAGETVEAPFFISWHFPNLTNNWNERDADLFGKRVGNWYATQWQDAWSVAEYAVENWPRLQQETERFFDTFFESTLPAGVLDAASANASIIRTTTCLRTEDGRLNAFEGCSENVGCCPMNCTHVWNYAQSMAYLFPGLERSVRLTDFKHNTRPNGDMAFRTLLPLADKLWAFKPAADGQMGTIMRAYREWLQCGDIDYLKAVWPGVVKALEFAWSPGGWDADKDGVMEGEQHNTYDIEFYGPNTMCGLFYLGALRAAGEMAEAMGEFDRAIEYYGLCERGREKYDALLWNGEYYDQKVEAPEKPQDSHVIAEGLPPSLQPGDTEPRYQYGPGCLADQVLGQWLARVVGLGDLLPQEKMKSALAAIVRHNFREDFSTHHSVQRVYAVNDEGGLLLCTWPNGGRPQYPFPYADEVWTGIEYYVAAHCIYEGLLDEGLRIVEAVRARHSGHNRNPWDEYECGHHYARAMSSWSLITALSGYHYNAAKGHLAFAPRINEDSFTCFFSTGTAWGLFYQTREGDIYSAKVEVRWGELTIGQLALPVDNVRQVTMEGRAISARSEAGVIRFSERVTIQAGQTLEVSS